MKKSKMIKIIKCQIRNDQDVLYDFQNGTLSFGKMAEILAKNILKTIEEEGMLPPATYIEGLPKIEGNKCILEWDKE